MTCDGCEFNKQGHCTVSMCAQVRASQYLAKGMGDMLPPWQGVAERGGGQAVNASLTEYLRDLADWIHHEAFHKLPDELEEKADEVRELAQTLESGVVVVPVEEARLAADAVAVYLSMGFQVTQAEIEQMRRFLSRLQQNGGEER